MNYGKLKEIERTNKKKLLEVNPALDEESGIYFLTRVNEDGEMHGYIGQAKHLLSRLAQHLTNYQYIDLSIKAHGLYSDKNPYGYKINFLHFPIEELDEKERYYIKMYLDKGYMLKNKTAGGQDEGKVKIAEYKPAKGYYDGLRQGYKNASKEIAHLFDKHLNVSVKSDKPNKIQQKALKKFNDFMEFYKESR